MEERIKMMQTRLKLKLEEGRNVNQELSHAREEKLRLEQENTRLRHRSDSQVWQLRWRNKRVFHNIEHLIIILGSNTLKILFNLNLNLIFNLIYLILRNLKLTMISDSATQKNWLRTLITFENFNQINWPTHRKQQLNHELLKVYFYLILQNW